jgi:hypothetical protein
MRVLVSTAVVIVLNQANFAFASDVVTHFTVPADGRRVIAAHVRNTFDDLYPLIDAELSNAWQTRALITRQGEGAFNACVRTIYRTSARFTVLQVSNNVVAAQRGNAAEFCEDKRRIKEWESFTEILGLLNSPLEFDGLNFTVDAPNLIGKTVTVSGGTVILASQESAQLRISGGGIILNRPWAEREDLRYVLRSCTSLSPDVRCKMAVTGIVGEPLGGTPRMRQVKFHVAP